METKKLRVSDLRMAEYNPRKSLRPGDEEWDKLKRSIEEFGYVSPIIVNKRNNVIVGGHQRFKVLMDLGYEEVLCVLVDMDEQHEKMLNISLNKISGEWDMDQLEILLKDFKKDGYDATITGFSMADIDDLLGDFNPLAENEDESKGETNDDKETMVICPKCQYMGEKNDFKD